MLGSMLYPFPAWGREWTTTRCALQWGSTWGQLYVVPMIASTAELRWTTGLPMDSAARTVRGATIYRHGAINDIIHRALHHSVPSRLEPSGLVRTDGKRPDGVTMIPWKNGKPLVWDATCPDTLAISYRSQATSSAGAVADLTECRKADKYSSLGVGYSFTPVAFETLGAMGKKSLAFVKDLGHRVRQRTGEAYLLQRLSVAVQRGNAVSVLGSVGGLDSQNWRICLVLYIHVCHCIVIPCTPSPNCFQYLPPLPPLMSCSLIYVYTLWSMSKFSCAFSDR